MVSPFQFNLIYNVLNSTAILHIILFDGNFQRLACLCCRCVFTSGEDSRVHESGHAEVGEGEEEDHSIIDGNDRGEIL